jgi:hypothetical protein
MLSTICTEMRPSHVDILADERDDEPADGDEQAFDNARRLVANDRWRRVTKRDVGAVTLLRTDHGKLAGAQLAIV